MRINPRGGCYDFFFFPSLSSVPSKASESSYSSIPLCNSSSATRVYLLFFGLSINGRPPAMSCRARRATSTTYENLLSGGWLETAMNRLSSKGFQNSLNAFAVLSSPATCAQRNSPHVLASLLEVLIDDHVIVIHVVLHFQAGAVETPGDFLIVVLAARANAFFEFFARRGHDENGHGFREFFPHLLGALHVDFKYQVLPLGARFVEPFLRRPVTVFAEHAGMFEKIAASNHFPEFFFLHKMIPLAVLFAGTRRARGG